MVILFLVAMFLAFENGSGRVWPVPLFGGLTMAFMLAGFVTLHMYDNEQEAREKAVAD